MKTCIKNLFLSLSPVTTELRFMGSNHLLRFGPAALLAAVFTFSCGSRASTLSVTVVTADNGLPARSVQWTDAAGQARTAIMVDQRAQGAGYLRRLTYQANGGSRVCTGTGDNGNQGDGYVQNHTAYGGDSSSHGTPGTTAVVLAGTHHAIISYNTVSYTHLRAHETRHDLVCRLLLEKKKN